MFYMVVSRTQISIIAQFGYTGSIYLCQLQTFFLLHNIIIVSSVPQASENFPLRQ